MIGCLTSTVLPLKLMINFKESMFDTYILILALIKYHFRDVPLPSNYEFIQMQSFAEAITDTIGAVEKASLHHLLLLV